MTRSAAGAVLLLLAAIFVLMLGRVLAQSAPTQLPSLRDVVHRPHAVTKHGDDAIKARKELVGCGADDLRAKLCLAGKYGMSVVFWCNPDGVTLCPGMYTTIGGVEKTAFIRPCQQWRECK
jgi:hypothetical protein